MAGRTPIYSSQIADTICVQIATTNKSMKEIAKYLNRKGIKLTWTTIVKWACDEKKYPEFVKAYEKAYKVRANLWAEERDALSREEITIPNPEEIADKYKLWTDQRTKAERRQGKPEVKGYDIRLVNKFLDQHIKKQENQIKRRIEVLTKNIGQLAQMHDRRYTSKYEVDNKHSGKVEGGAITMVSFAPPPEKDVTPNTQVIEKDK